MHSLIGDIRYALRQLRRSPGFALTIIATPALGIGSATAVFSVIDAVLLRPLPFAHPERLVFPDTHARSGYRQPWSYLSYVDARRELKSFAAMENWLFGIFAGPALLPALVGLYGLTGHEVELRTRDIGIRMALGSTRGWVVRQIVGREGSLMAAGIGLGWLLTLGLRRVIASVVELHAAHDATLLAGLTVLVGLIGIAASLLPARRAASIDPMQALRAD